MSNLDGADAMLGQGDILSLRISPAPMLPVTPQALPSPFCGGEGMMLAENLNLNNRAKKQNGNEGRLLLQGGDNGGYGCVQF